MMFGILVAAGDETAQDGAARLRSNPRAALDAEPMVRVEKKKIKMGYGKTENAVELLVSWVRSAKIRSSKA